ncbi:hypothetical protein C7999DRAFT_14499 [Corynascus novoguineensis]|uniref:Rhodopsin domain-containing protein n=1 Tax=Corynascus novoguineensis TaxID=1126955 RepID=A0AAN7HNY7_9PEZI|nr:hypothetical protein C7999DRAFT_14499 [Corynascus novoguineensis]
MSGGPTEDANRADESIADDLIECVVVLMAIMLVVVSLRFYIRLRLLRKAGNDDIALAATMVRTIHGPLPGILFFFLATRHGLGHHIETLSLEERSFFLKLVYAASLGYHVTIMLLKATFLLQFRRVFPLPVFQRVCDIFLVFLGLWTIAGIIGGALICLPVSKNWDLQEPIWTCDERFYFWLVHGLMHLITDLIIFVMPLPLLKTLPLPPAHKFVLLGVFCLGFLTCIFSGVRLTTLHASLRDPDVTWTSAVTVFWSDGEVACSIICLCIPTLRPLMGKCCTHRTCKGNIMERGTRRFGFYAISLPSSVGPPPVPSPSRAPDPAHTNNNRIS